MAIASAPSATSSSPPRRRAASSSGVTDLAPRRRARRTSGAARRARGTPASRAPAPGRRSGCRIWRPISSTSREAFGGEQPDARALALQHGVGGDRRAVHEPARRRSAAMRHSRCRCGDAREHRGARVAARGRAPSAMRIGPPASTADDVGEGAADVDADAQLPAHAAPSPVMPGLVPGIHVLFPPVIARSGATKQSR